MSFAAAHTASLDDDFPEAIGARDPMPDSPKQIMSEQASDDFADRPHEDRVYAHNPAMQHTEVAPEPVSLDGVSREIMRGHVLSTMSGNLLQDDLDVPAFLRKRNEVM